MSYKEDEQDKEDRKTEKADIDFLPEECLAEIDDVIDKLNNSLSILEKLDKLNISHFSFYESRYEIKLLIEQVNKSAKSFVEMGCIRLQKERAEKEKKDDIYG